MVYSWNQINQTATSFFQNLFTSSTPVTHPMFRKAIEGKLNQRFIDELKVEYNIQEVVTAVKQLGKDKSPGPDGYNDIISQNQAGFVSGRLLTDNVILAVMQFVKSVKGAVLINGSPGSQFQQSRGIRQGDPLSPFLFILAQESLSSALNQNESKNLFKGIKVTYNSPSISHLAFADDIIFFGKASKDNVLILQDILNNFLCSSGHSFNLAKSELLFSKKLEVGLRAEIADIFQVQEVRSFGRYLGLPLKVGRNKTELFDYLIQKVRKRVGGWGKPMSQASRSILVSSVLQAIPSFTMSIFQLPRGIIHKLNSIIANFWWGGREKTRSMHWIKWREVCEDVDKGGLGFKEIEAFNKALITKQLWRICKNPSNLVSIILRNLYFPEGTIQNATPGKHDSPVWKSFVANVDNLSLGLRKQVGNGSNTLFWKDPWLPRSEGFKVIAQNQEEANSQDLVSEFIDKNSGRWNRAKLKDNLTDYDVDCILSINPNLVEQDEWIWNYTLDGNYSVKSGYIRIHSHMQTVAASSSSPSSSSFKQINNLHICPKAKLIAWKMIRNITPCQANLARRIGGSSKCFLCGKKDTIVHSFFLCCFVSDIWSNIINTAELAAFSDVECIRWMNERICNWNSSKCSQILDMLWVVYDARNKVKHNTSFAWWPTVEANKAYIYYYHNMQNSTCNRAQTEGWVPPPVGEVRLGWAIDQKQGSPIRIGGLIRNNNGVILAWFFAAFT